MDPNPVYEQIRGRIQDLLTTETNHGGKGDELELQWNMPDGTWGKLEEPYQYRSVGVLVENGNWFTSLVEEVKLEVRWKRLLGLEDDRQSFVSVVLSFKPKSLKAFKMPFRGPMFVMSLQIGQRKKAVVRYGSEIKYREENNTFGWQFMADPPPDQQLGLNRYTFPNMFGSAKVRLILSLRLEPVHLVLCHEISNLINKTNKVDLGGSHVSILTDKDKRLVELARRRQAILLDFEDGLLRVKCEGSQRIFKIPKSTLASHSPDFEACFRHPETLEIQSSCYTIASSTPGAVENFMMYCEYLLAPEMGENCIELAKLAHKYQVPALLNLCELHMMANVCEFVDCDSEGFAAKFEAFLALCQCASLLELPLLLSQLHLVIVNLEQKVIYMPQWSTWKDFLKGLPDFAIKRHQAVDDMERQ